MSHRISALTPLIGAEVRGVDLNKRPDATTATSLNKALLDHKVLVVRDQNVTPEGYLGAVSTFGEPMRQHYSQYNLADVPDVSEISNRHGQAPATMWHTDHTNHECPPKATVLYGVAIPSTGGDTSFANMAAAYAALPDATKRRVEGLQTLNGFDTHRAVLAEDRDKYPEGVTHPLVRTHPETGVKALYFHVTKTHRIAGMTPADSAGLLDDLLEQSIRPDFVYRHRWQRGDMVIFDNRCVLHRVHDDYDRSEPRLLHRIILKGDRPY